MYLVKSEVRAPYTRPMKSPPKLMVKKEAVPKKIYKRRYLVANCRRMMTAHVTWSAGMVSMRTKTFIMLLSTTVTASENIILL